MKTTSVLILIAFRFSINIGSGDDWKTVESNLDIPFKWSNSIIEVKTKSMSKINEDSKLEISFSLDIIQN